MRHHTFATRHALLCLALAAGLSLLTTQAAAKDAKAPEAGAGSEPAAPDHLHPMMTTWPAHKAH